jgi:hypothetical protein
MAEYLRFARDNGVRAYYGEAYPNFGEGPKIYLAYKLLWNPDLDVDSLLDEWYSRAVGKEAAAYLKEYYCLWEDVWTNRMAKSEWIRYKQEWLPITRPGYLRHVTEEDIAKSRRLLETVLDKARTPRQKARAAALLQAFEYYEASVIAFLGDVRAENTTISSPGEALKVLLEGARCLEMADRRYYIVDKVLAKDPVLRHPKYVRPDTKWYWRSGKPATLAGRDWGEKLFRLAEPWATDVSVNARLKQLAAASKSETVRRHAKAMLKRLKGLKKTNRRANETSKQSGGSQP